MNIENINTKIIDMLEPNVIISITDVVVNNGKVEIQYINDSGVENKASLVIEDIKTKKAPAATIKDWETFKDMLAETAIAPTKMSALELESMTKANADFDSYVALKSAEIMAKFVTEPENIPTLALELPKLNENRAEKVAIIAKDILDQEVEKLKNEARNRKSFFVGGIKTFINGENISRAIEIPQPAKKARNMRTISNNELSMQYSFNYEGKPLTIEDVNKGVEISKVSITSKVSPINDKENLEKLFIVNENCLNGLSGAKGETLFGRLLDVYGKSEVAKEFSTFKKSIKFEDMTVENIDKLKELYGKVKDDVLANGLNGYNINVKVFFDNNDKERFLDRVVKGINEGIMGKLTKAKTEEGVKITPELPNEVKLVEVNGLNKFPTNKGVLNDQWYSSIRTSDGGKVSNISGHIEGEVFTSTNITKQIKDLIKQELTQTMNDVNDIEK